MHLVQFMYIFILIVYLKSNCLLSLEVFTDPLFKKTMNSNMQILV